ncbi:MAG: indole-3-glycerol phosphate synthase TrpC [Candidatus Geothermincolia bacterium]
MNVLEKMAAVTRQRLEREPRLSRESVESLLADAPAVIALEGALRRANSRPAVIAEIKRHSPSRGPMRPDLVAGELARTYETAGASAISVLTEPHFFGGSLGDLASARGSCSLPLLAKDIILDGSQVVAARLAGAGGVLLMASLLNDRELRALKSLAASYGMDALVEVRCERELESALGAGATLVGVNNRDLKTLRVDLECSRRLLPLLPPGVLGVSESGISSREELEEVGRAGAAAVLVGTSLVTSVDPGAALRALTAPGKGERPCG